MGKIIIHPAAKKIVVKQIMDEVRAIKNLRAIAKELKGSFLYSPEVCKAIERIKERKLTKVK